MKAPINLKDLGVEPKDFDFISDQALLATRLVANNPRELTKKAVLEILSRGYNQDLSWWEYSE
jgi:alcohol dehydrogenase class IV